MSADQPAAHAGTTTNSYAIASLALGIAWLGWIGSILALVFGPIALRQIRNSAGRETGRGLAIAGIIVGLLGVALFLGVFIAAMPTW